MPRLFRTRNLAVAALSLGLTVAAVPSALATESEDPRATIHEGNATDCEQFGGGILVKVDDTDPVENASLTYEGGVLNQDKYLTITGVPDGIAVTAIVVKGGNHYNVYVPGERGLSEDVPWEDLRSPLNNGGNIPTISHWFACGEEAPSEVPTTEPETTEPNPGQPEPSEPGSEEPPTSEPTDVPSSTAVSEPITSNPAGGPGAPETTESAPAPVAEDDDLASTGFSSGWLIGLGAALLVGGGALLAVTRMRKGKATS